MLLDHVRSTAQVVSIADSGTGYFWTSTGHLGVRGKVKGIQFWTLVCGILGKNQEKAAVINCICNMWVGKSIAWRPTTFVIKGNRSSPITFVIRSLNYTWRLYYISCYMAGFYNTRPFIWHISTRFIDAYKNKTKHSNSVICGRVFYSLADIWRDGTSMCISF